MAKMNWRAASSRNKVLKYGSERSHNDLKTSDKESHQERLDRESGTLGCGTTDAGHRWGPKHVLSTEGLEGQNCLQCGKTKSFQRRGSKVLFLEESKLVRLQSQLTGEPSDSGSSRNTITSIRKPLRLDSSNQVRPNMKARHLEEFDSKIHVLMRGPSNSWKCLCSWKGVESEDVEKARELHRRQWEKRSESHRRDWDLQAITAALAIIRSSKRG